MQKEEEETGFPYTSASSFRKTVRLETFGLFLQFPRSLNRADMRAGSNS